MDSLTTEFYESVLKTYEKFDVKINRFEMKDACGKWDNFMSQVQSVQLYGSQNNTDYYKSIIIKTQPPIEQGLLYRSHIAMENEVNAYTKIIPALNKYLTTPLPFPHCFYADSEVIVLENLCENGYKAVGTKTGGLSLIQCEIVVKILAKLHAASFIMQDKDPEEFKQLAKLTKEILFYETESKLLDHQSNSIETAMQLIKELPDSPRHTKAVKILADIKRNSRLEFKQNLLNPGLLSVFCHGDCWSGNIMFNPFNDLKLIDVQLMRCNSVATDLIYLFYTNLPPQERRDNEERMLKIYLEELEETLNDKRITLNQLISADWLKDEISKWRLYGFVWAIWTLPVYFNHEDTNSEGLGKQLYKRRLYDLILGYVDNLE